MRRPTPQLPISPKLLKQFAGSTLVITGLVALFANGEAEQAQDVLRDRQARNQALVAEARQNGPKPLATRVTSQAPAGSWGSDAVDQPASTNTSGSGARLTAPSVTSYPTPDPVKLMAAPGRKLTVENQLAIDLPGPVGDAARAKVFGKQKKALPRPTAAQIEQIKAASRLRTGSPDTRD